MNHPTHRTHRLRLPKAITLLLLLPSCFTDLESEERSAAAKVALTSIAESTVAKQVLDHARGTFVAHRTVGLAGMSAMDLSTTSVLTLSAA